MRKHFILPNTEPYAIKKQGKKRRKNKACPSRHCTFRTSSTDIKDRRPANLTKVLYVYNN